jgi:hypothetical protein
LKVIWLTGESGVGKTILAERLQENWPCVILDGDEMRDSISLKAGFSRKDRAEHNYRVARLAKVLSEQSNVVVSVIAPIRSVRADIDDICSPEWVWVRRKVPEREGHFYEVPDGYYRLNHDILSIEQSCKTLMSLLGIEKKIYSLFIGRWQSREALHNGHLALFDKVRSEGKNIAIGIRDTEKDENNPLSATERKSIIEQQVPDAKVFVMPDIEEVVYGRRVGWGVRELRLDDVTESISATKIRETF